MGPKAVWRPQDPTGAADFSPVDLGQGKTLFDRGVKIVLWCLTINTVERN
jgi:hypothetical protein